MLLNEALRAVVRTEEDRNVEASAATLDRQTVRSEGHGAVWATTRGRIPRRRPGGSMGW